MNNVGLPDLGIPELLIAGMILVSWAVPLAAAIWLFLTLRHIRDTQDAMRATLESIDRKMSAGN